MGDMTKTGKTSKTGVFPWAPKTGKKSGTKAPKGSQKSK